MDKFRIIKEQAQRFGLATGALFLIITTYMRVKFVFDSGNFAGTLLLISVVLAISTVLLGLLSLPKWQAWTALIISAYALYLLFSTTLLCR
jgi:cobalamin biosynthesis protein CobD/CbiB